LLTFKFIFPSVHHPASLSVVYGESLDLGVDCALIVLLWRCWWGPQSYGCIIKL